nr:MAG TPA: hypothetical protein [Caudoviricetes sp.]
MTKNFHLIKRILKGEAIMGSNLAGTDFMSIPDGIDEELPFN